MISKKVAAFIEAYKPQLIEINSQIWGKHATMSQHISQMTTSM